MKLGYWIIIATISFCQIAAAGVENYDAAFNQANQFETDEDFRTAQQLYGQLIEAIESQENGYSESLIEPLIALGRTHLALGEFDAAEQTLRRAQHLIHRNEGVHATRQLEIVDLLTEISIETDRPFDADRQQHFALSIAEHNVPAESEDLLPALSKVTRWYIDTGQYYHARESLERTMQVIEKANGAMDDRLIAPLMLSANVKRLQGSSGSYRYLESASKIVEANPDLPIDAKADVFEALADAYLADNKEAEAALTYAKVWALLGSETAENRFAQPGQIAMSQGLRMSSGISKQILIIENNQFGVSRTKLLNDKEALLLDSQPPQQFSVPLAASDRKIHINDVFSPNDVIAPSQRVVGRPFQFALKQLQHILPASVQNESELAMVRLELRFTVKSDGRVRDIEVSSGNAPNRLIRLMREVLYKATFRPRMVDGKPVETAGFQLTQTFDR